MSGFGTRIFGGSTVGQGIVAAASIATPGRLLNSMQSYFVAPGDVTQPTEYRATPLKIGTTIDLIDVEAWQGERRTFAMRASFHQLEPSRDYDLPMPAVPGPELLETDPGPERPTSRAIRAPFDCRYPPAEDLLTVKDGGVREERAWVKTREPVGSDDPSDHAALLGFISDSFITRTAHLPLSDGGVQKIGASLDHSMWFHRDFRMDEWLLFQSETLSYSRARVISRTVVFNISGNLVASATQEALLREG